LTCLLRATLRASPFAAWLFPAVLAVRVFAADGGAVDAPANAQATYYVSPQGNDCNPGSLAAPFRTLTKAGMSCAL